MGDASVDDCMPLPSDPCLFPVLNTFSGQSQDSVKYVRVGLEKNQIRKFCDSWDIELPQLLQLTWVIVLRTYTGSKCPLFRYVDSQQIGLLCSLDLSEKQRTASLAKNIVFWEDAAMGLAQCFVNTAVTWNAGNKGHSKQVRSRKQHESSDAEKNLAR